MRTASFCAAVFFALATVHCGGSGSISHPNLDQDYAANFTGTWEGPATLAFAGQPPQTATLSQRIDAAGFNRLAIVDLCPGVAGKASLDSATTFSVDPLTCTPADEGCGPVTIRYDGGTGKLAQETLTLTLTGAAAGCNRNLTFTLTFTGRLPAPVDHGPPVAMATSPVSTLVGVPVTLDASGSSDPDGRPLTFAWSITSSPSGTEPVLTGADTPKPTFTSSGEGIYLVRVLVSASDGQSANATVEVSVRRPIPPGQTHIELLSDSGDFIGAGGVYAYTKADATIVPNGSGGYLSLSIHGDEDWMGEFKMPSAFTQFQPGTYAGLQRYPFNDPVAGGLEWSGQSRGCNTLSGSFTVNAVAYAAGALTLIDLDFVQHCESATPALHGHVHWDASDPTQPPGPASPPSGLWQAPLGSTPATGNYVYLESQAGDYIGAGGTFAYSQANALLSVTSSGSHLSLGIRGDQDWSGDFQGMSTIAQLQPGFYGGLQRYPFHNPARGGLDWSGEGRGCNTLSGWFVIDDVVYANGALTSIDLRFEQHCEGVIAALHGQVHWDNSDTTQPPGPVDPPPSGLWAPAPTSTPASGNYIYLQSDPGDYIGAGRTYTYTPATAAVSFSPGTNRLSLSVNGDEGWSGDFQAMTSITRLQPGYYGDLERYPFYNPVRGGLDWGGEGRGCNTLRGWFVVDDVTYTGAALTAIDLRFEQHCEGAAPALHGAIHWDVNDTTAPPGPIDPPPGLWQPAGGTPASGNFVYLESQPGDYIGAGATYTYTPSSATISVTGSGAHASVSVSGWFGDFQGMSSIAQLQPGYYGGLERYPFYNPARGGLSWSGQGRGCNTLTGWFVVDAVTYVNGALTALDLRFEQHCEGGPPALHGQIVWTAGP